MPVIPNKKMKPATDSYDDSDDEDSIALIQRLENGDDDDDDDNDENDEGDDNRNVDDNGVAGGSNAGGKKHAMNIHDFSTGAPPGNFDPYVNFDLRKLHQKKERNKEVVRNILANFNLEEVMDRYRGPKMIRDYSHSNRKFRLWLEKVMGTDRVELDDKEWHRLFRQKVMEDYEHQLREREKELAEAEVQRVQRLRLQGVLTAEDDPRDVSHKIRMKFKTKTKKVSPNKHQELYRKPHDDIETQMEIWQTRSGCEDRHKNKQLVRPEQSDDDDDGGGGGQKNNIGVSDERECDGTGDSKNNILLAVDAPNTHTVTNDDEDDRIHKSQPGTLVTSHKNPSVHRLYNEEDLQQLYAHAATMIRVSPKSNK